MEENLLASLRHARDDLSDDGLIALDSPPKTTKGLLQGVLRRAGIGYARLHEPCWSQEFNGKWLGSLLALLQDSQGNPSFYSC